MVMLQRLEKAGPARLVMTAMNYDDDESESLSDKLLFSLNLKILSPRIKCLLLALYRTSLLEEMLQTLGMFCISCRSSLALADLIKAGLGQRRELKHAVVVEERCLHG
jgi:hypothetical protein